MLPRDEPLIVSPSTPTELLTFILQHHRYPSTIIICCSRAEFVKSLIHCADPSSINAPRNGQGDLDPQPHADTKTHDDERLRRLLAKPLYQVAIARHIRLVFVPTVTHLRAYLSVFARSASHIQPPPGSTPHSHRRLLVEDETIRRPLLMVFEFLQIHRETSEWSAQGLSATAAHLLEAADRERFRAVILEPRKGVERSDFTLSEEIPVLSTQSRRLETQHGDVDRGVRMVPLSRVFRRWFAYSPFGPGQSLGTQA